ncbi:hypothetical protein [Flagellimonas olearia]|uniref:DoxX family protein n=1 Tax=Flagellimonas olearia TaxID=552546 RepID=A0A444VJS2_9FLAO|nr:hypothetical protein [Allomuricauda olearia]RYC51013.1 hypothetical protein DN53_15350 [Allomuricauda olearia]
MIKNIISLLLLGISVFLSLKHGLEAFPPIGDRQLKILGELGIDVALMPYFGVFSIIIGLMLLWPRTFVLSNILHALVIVLLIVLALKAGNYTLPLLEIPFLAMPLLLIYLKYPFNIKF